MPLGHYLQQQFQLHKYAGSGEGSVNDRVTLGWLQPHAGWEPSRKEGLFGSPARWGSGKHCSPVWGCSCQRTDNVRKTAWVSEGPGVVAEEQFRAGFCPGRSCFGFLSVVSGLLPNLAFVPLRRLWNSCGFTEFGALKRLFVFLILNHAGFPSKHRIKCV